MKDNQIKITDETLFLQASDLDATQLDGEKVIMDLMQGCYYMMNQTATTIWNLMQTPQTVTSLTKTLIQQYEIDEESCRQQVMLLIKKLFSLKLLIMVSADKGKNIL